VFRSFRGTEPWPRHQPGRQGVQRRHRHWRRFNRHFRDVSRRRLAVL